jgi:TetR/AcrR family transcriptional regulator, transcriptional repressor for nem operon
MGAKSEQKEQTHEMILASAARLLREKGIAGARVAEVMKGAGLTVGGFYAHFVSKEALIRDAMRRTGAEMRARLFERLDEKPAADRAEVILKRYLSAAHRDEGTPRGCPRTLRNQAFGQTFAGGGQGCPLPAVVGEIATTAGEHAELLAEELNAMASAIQRHVPPSPGSIAPRHLALGLVALMVGGLSLARALRGTPLSDDVLRACRALGRRAIRRDTDDATVGGIP